MKKKKRTKAELLIMYQYPLNEKEFNYAEKELKRLNNKNA